eukprot:TRINITY_DN1710_c0_g1_i2.p1 TRINITY_DN1710_c0_g1~~TRINITY_DN1710_c0_g1_i2.p1  ORF type:complete len:690 (-),score=195.62 TRINITY_DN1710_c0_g1_i2:473-2503(-)
MSFTENQGEIVGSAQEVQSSQNKPKWVLFGYASEESELVKVVEKGEGFLSTVLSHFKSDSVLYLLVGVETVEEGDYKLIKRLLVTWVGPEVKPLHKARSSQHRVLLYDLIKPHVKLAGEYQALSIEDLTEEKLRGKVSGAKVEESDEERLKRAAELDASKRRKGSAAPAPVFQPTSGSGASSFSWADEEAAKAAVEELRKAHSSLNWVLFDYQDKTVIRMAAKGSGGISEFESHLTGDACVFGVLAVKVQEGDFSTVKFLFVSWAGPEVKPPVRARSSQHRVALYSYVDKIVTLAGELQALSKDDFSESIILSKLTGSRQLGDSKEKVSSKSTAKTETSSFDFHFADEESVKSLLTNFREKKNWVVFGYDSGHGDKLVTLGSGSGGLEEVEPFLKEEEVVYFVLGVNTPEGEYSLIKFILVTWVGPSVKPMFKARSSQHRVPLYKYVNVQVPLSGESQALSRDDLSNDALIQKLLGSRATSSGDPKAAAPKRTVGSNEFRFADEENAKSSIQELRKDGSKTNWVVLGYPDSDDIKVLHKGSGDISNFNSLLNDDSINYVITGVDLKEGDYTITKFILITWVGKDVKPMAKARSSQHRNPLYKYVNTYCQLAGEIQILSREGLSNQALVEKLLGAKTVQGEQTAPVHSSPTVSKRSTAGQSSGVHKEAGEIKVTFFK